MWQKAFCVAVSAFAAVACAQSGGSSAQAPATLRKDVVIQFGDLSVEPSVARVAAGGSVTWVSLSTSYQGVISFPESIKQHLTCTQLRPDFFEAGGRVQSIPIGNASESLELPCPLKPGSYDYRVDLYAGSEGMAGPGIGMSDPLRSLDAKLIVE